MTTRDLQTQDTKHNPGKSDDEQRGVAEAGQSASCTDKRYRVPSSVQSYFPLLFGFNPRLLERRIILSVWGRRPISNA